MKIIATPEVEAKLRKALAYLAEEPKRLDMDIWGYRFDRNNSSQTNIATRIAKEHRIAQEEMPPCGTAVCLAGAIMLACAPEKVKFYPWGGFFDTPQAEGEDRIAIFDDTTPKQATDELGLDEGALGGLFLPNCWPGSLRQQYNDAALLNTPADRAQARLAAATEAVECWLAGDGNIYAGHRLRHSEVA